MAPGNAGWADLSLAMMSAGSMVSSMNVFVTGGAGYIGSVCVEELLEAGHTVTVYDNLSEGHRQAVAPAARFVAGCLSERARLRQSLADSGAEVIIHFAALALVSESMTHPGKYFANNVGFGLNLIECARELGVRKLVFSSTCATYGVPERVPMTEDLGQTPINPYGESKLMFEKILKWYHQLHQLEYVIFRYFNAAGASARFGEHHRIESHLIPNVLKVALGQASECFVYGADYATPDGTCIRDYIHVADLAQAHILAMKPGLVGCYNLGNGGGYSVRQVIQACETITGNKLRAVDRPRRPGDPPRLIAAADKAKRELGWEPRKPQLDAIVASAWEWHRQHPSGYAD
jgi:UDP-glucose 4-epimerase